jgi:hypothetical protein
MKFTTLLVFTFIMVGLAVADSPGGKQRLFREEFRTLDRWTPLFFPKIRKHTEYKVDSGNDEYFLLAESDASASALVYEKEFNIYDYPMAQWRWRVDAFSLDGNPQTKSGDDYPLRVYFLFHYDPETASFTEKIKYGLAKTIYGQYPPHSTLSYVWSYRADTAPVYPSPYTGRAKIIVLQKGGAHTGKWVIQEVDVAEDYKKAFGQMPPSAASIAVMNDSDNTQGYAVSRIDFIEVYRDVP